MIDIHNHIIYDCDDGSQSIEQSIKMIKAAKDAGIDELCFTPHYMEDGYKSEKDVLAQKLDVLKEVILKEGIDVKLYLGEEVFIFPDLAQHLDDVICLNNSRYLLFELPLVEEVNFAEDVLYKLISFGITPILAHPERYYCTLKDFSFVENLIQKGVLLQVNINSLIGHYGKDVKKLAIRLLKEDLVHFVASDAHTVSGYLAYSDSTKALKKVVGEDKFKELTEINQRKVLLNQEIEISRVYNERKKPGLFSFWDRKRGNT